MKVFYIAEGIHLCPDFKQILALIACIFQKNNTLDIYWGIPQYFGHVLMIFKLVVVGLLLFHIGIIGKYFKYYNP